MIMLEMETITPSSDFLLAIKEPTLKPRRNYEGPDSVDLAVSQFQVEELGDFTNSHPQRFEAGRPYYLERDGEVSTDADFTIGMEPARVIFDFKLGIDMELIDNANIPKLVRQERVLASVAHSHPHDTPPSFEDLEKILLPSMRPAANTSILVITPKRKLLTFRGEKTPLLDDPKSALKSVDREASIYNSQRRMQHVIDGKSALEIYIETSKDDFRYAAGRLDLQVFEGGVRDRYLQRMKPHDIAR